MNIENEKRTQQKTRHSWINILSILLAVILVMCICGAYINSSVLSTRAKTEAELNANGVETMAATDGLQYDMYDEQEAGEDLPDDANSESLADEKNSRTQSAYKIASVKLIRRASLTLETKEFQPAIDGLEQLVEDMGGYIENSNLNQGNYWDSSSTTYREASYTVRIPSEKYDEFLSRASSEKHCHLSDKSVSTEDIGQQYFDTETRLKTLRMKLDRLQGLLAQAKKMDDIISLEQAITDTEYEIESHTSTINRYDSLIDYSVFNITVRQVIAISDADTTPYLARLGNAFVGGFDAFIDGFQDVTVWFASNIFSITIMTIIISSAFNIVQNKRAQKKAAATFKSTNNDDNDNFDATSSTEAVVTDETSKTADSAEAETKDRGLIWPDDEAF